MEYLLDIASWRCGGDGDHRLGDGDTMMRTLCGYMCCLGQFAVQRGVHEDELMHHEGPGDVAACLERVYDPLFVTHPADDVYRNSDLADTLLGINDKPETTPREKIAAIREELAKHGHTLRVVNENLLPASA